MRTECVPARCPGAEPASGQHRGYKSSPCRQDSRSYPDAWRAAGCAGSDRIGRRPVPRKNGDRQKNRHQGLLPPKPSEPLTRVTTLKGPDSTSSNSSSRGRKICSSLLSMVKCVRAASIAGCPATVTESKGKVPPDRMTKHAAPVSIVREVPSCLNLDLGGVDFTGRARNDFNAIRGLASRPRPANPAGPTGPNRQASVPGPALEV